MSNAHEFHMGPVAMVAGQDYSRAFVTLPQARGGACYPAEVEWAAI
jgi:hypothetical protein